MIQLSIIIAYFVTVIAIGILSRRKHWGLDDFFVSGRRCSSILIAGSLLATIIGGSATIGLAGLGFKQGLTGAWWLLVGCVGLLVLGFFFARKVRNFGLYTLSGMMGKQYDSRVSLAASILISVAWLGVIAGQILAAGKIMSFLGVGSPTLWMILFTLIFTGYVILGGQDAVIRTDILQIVLIFAGIFAALGILLWHTGGIGQLLGSLPADRSAFPLSPQFGPLELLSYLFLVGSTYAVGPDMYSRLFCAKDGRTAKIAVLWTAILLIPIAFAVTLIGMGASSLFPQISSEQAFPSLVSGILPPLAGGLVLAALLSAVMSSADTTLMSASTILTVDIIGKMKPSLYERKALFISRIGILLVALVSLLLALRLQGVISSLLFAYTIYTSGIIIPVIAGFYRKKLKVTPLGALAAIIGGGGTALISKLLVIKYLDLGSLLVSILLLFTVSMVENWIRSQSISTSKTGTRIIGKI